jgi:hypothetical protein
MHTIAATIPNDELRMSTRAAENALGIEASDIGMRAGIWPDAIIVNTSLVYLRTARIDAHGEFGGFVYALRGGSHKLNVYND